MARGRTSASGLAVLSLVLIGGWARPTLAQGVPCPCFQSQELVAYVRIVDALGEEGVEFFFCAENGNGTGRELHADSTSGELRPNYVIASTQPEFRACSVNVDIQGHLIKSYGWSDLSAAELSACETEFQTACEELVPLDFSAPRAVPALVVPRRLYD